MPFISTQRPFPLLSVRRILLLAVVVSLCFILSTGGAGAQTVDDHGNFLSTATTLSLGSTAAGRNDPGDDSDLFKLDLSGASGDTDVWIYTTGGFDTWGGLYDGSGAPILSNDDAIPGRQSNFYLRAILAIGIYYIGVNSSDGTTTGNYTLHAQAVEDHGGSTGTATLLNLRSPTPGAIGRPADADYFRLVLTEPTNLVISALSLNGEPVDGKLLDSRGAELSVNIYPRTDYTNFIDNCEAETVSLNNPQIGDLLYGCQWHLNNREGEDISVEAVWADGFKGEGVNVRVF